MAMHTNSVLSRETIAALQELIQVNLDSRDGFVEASENVEEMSIGSLFRELAAERNGQASELRSLVASQSKEPADSGSYVAAAHRLWMDLRAAVGGGSAAMLSEAERGEDHIKRKYEETMMEHQGETVREILQRHYEAVKASHDRVRELRDHYNEFDT